MSKYGFLDVLEEEMDKVFPFDFEINWDKKNHAVEVAFLLEAQNTGGVALVDEAGEESDEDIFFEEAVIFYNPAKSHVEEDAYLTAIPYEPKKGLSREFLAYFATFLKDTAELALDGLMDFLADEEAESFEIVWNQEVFEEAVLFYNPAKSHVEEDAYLTAIPYEPKKGLSREFLAYFATFLRDTAELALDELMDFLADEEAESFEIVWNQEVFEEGKVGLEESTFYPYPRY